MSEILIDQTNDGQTRLEVQFGEDTVWLGQALMAELFQRDQSVIAKHLMNIQEEPELDLDSNMQKLPIAGSDKPVSFCNLDVIISVGYRVKSQRGTQFRRWATQRLRELLVKGFALNYQRFSKNGTDRHFEELLQRIQDIRSSAKILWRKVLDIYATNEDYDVRDEISKQLNKMHWAAHSHTSAEFIEARADHTKPSADVTKIQRIHTFGQEVKFPVAQSTMKENLNRFSTSWNLLGVQKS